MRASLLAAIAGAALVAGDARAAAELFTSRAAFDAAIADLAPLASLDFDSVAGDTVIPSGTTLDGFTIFHSIAGVDVIVVDDLATTSGTNSLGTAGDLTFLASDAVALGFAPATAIGLYVIGEDMIPGDVELQTPVGSVANDQPEGTVADGSAYYFLGVVEMDPSQAFSNASVTSHGAVGDFVWNADDLVTAPEVDGATAGVLALACFAINRRRGSSPPRARSASRPGR